MQIAASSFIFQSHQILILVRNVFHIGAYTFLFDSSFALASTHTIKSQSASFPPSAMAALKFGAKELDYVKPCDESVLARSFFFFTAS